MQKKIIWPIVTIIILMTSNLEAGINPLGNEDSGGMVYGDDSHCLVANELRGMKDKPISCFCRDAIMDARYLYQTYLITRKDQKLYGAYLTLENHAQQMCGEKYDVCKAIQTKEWQWDGPQVTRGHEVKILSNNDGSRSLEYKVYLTYFGTRGDVIKADSFTTVDKLFSNPQN